MCNGCRLTAVDALTITKLSCLNCMDLKILPLMPCLRKLDCSYCLSLSSLPIFPRLENFYISTCPLLPLLPEMPSLKSMTVFNCLSLIMIEEMPVLQHFTCKNCPRLKYIGIDKVPKVFKSGLNTFGYSLPDNVDRFFFRRPLRVMMLPYITKWKQLVRIAKRRRITILRLESRGIGDIRDIILKFM